jgi:hypothetical protein
METWKVLDCPFTIARVALRKYPGYQVDRRALPSRLSLLSRTVPGNVETVAPSNPRSRQLPVLKVLSLSHRLNTSQNLSILRPCSHVVRFIDSPPNEGEKPDN